MRAGEKKCGRRLALLEQAHLCRHIYTYTHTETKRHAAWPWDERREGREGGRREGGREGRREGRGDSPSAVGVLRRRWRRGTTMMEGE